MIYGYNIQLCQTLCSFQRNQLKPLLWPACCGLNLYICRPCTEKKWNTNMKWKLAACKYAPEVKGKQDPLRSTCLFSEHCHRHPANTLASALSLEGTLLPRGGSQTGAPGHIHQALLNYCVKKGECKCSQRPTKHSHFDFPLSFVLLSLPVRLLSWHTNCRREPKHFKKRNPEEAWDLSEPFWIWFWASDTSDSVIQGMLLPQHERANKMLRANKLPLYSSQMKIMLLYSY